MMDAHCSALIIVSALSINNIITIVKKIEHEFDAIKIVGDRYIRKTYED